MRSPRRAMFPALAVGLLALAGCGRGYTAEVRNDSGRQVLARIVRDRTLDADQILAQAAIADGETIELGPVRAAPLDEVTLEVSRPGDVGDLPSERRLRRGYNAFVVEPGSSEDWSGFVVRPVAD